MRLQLVILAIGFLLSIGDARAPLYFPWWRLHTAYYFFLAMTITPYRKVGIALLLLLWLLHWQSGTFFEMIIWTIAALSLSSLFDVVNRLTFFPLLIGAFVITLSMLLSHHTSSPLLNITVSLILISAFYGFFAILSSSARTTIQRV